MCFVYLSLFLMGRLQRRSGWNLRRSATLIDLLEPWWYKCLCRAKRVCREPWWCKCQFSDVVLQTSIWQPYHYIMCWYSVPTEKPQLSNTSKSFLWESLCSLCEFDNCIFPTDDREWCSSSNKSKDFEYNFWSNQASLPYLTKNNLSHFILSDSALCELNCV